MKFDCTCSATIIDQTDDLPHKARLIPDQNWSATFEAIDAEVIAPLAAGRITEDAAAHLVRTIVLRSTRLMYQCRECGRLHLDDCRKQLQRYAPEGDGARDILRGAWDTP